jgi:tRNA nucleotidyltransferase/poly(A) polymerase
MTETIAIAPEERRLFDFLLDVVRAKAPETILRAAGGWVRDKLLGLSSHDIDIAINNMSGASFANLVVQYMEERGQKHGKVTVIAARPDQSKHLETAELHVFGHVIDFANLRKETYAESRIPVIEPGTPLEDAQRRDLTINSLFYNLNEGVIEDWTGEGLPDLKKGVCRTPIDPIQTFIDDPLRVLRAIRFAAKLQFEVADELAAAAADPRVHEAFKSKISKERIWAEMIGQAEPDSWKHGFLIGPNPALALQLLHRFGFRDILFRPDPDNLHSWDDEQNNPHHDLDIWSHSVASFKYLLLDSIDSSDGFAYRFSEEDMAVRVLSMILHDIGKCCPEFRQQHPDGHTTYKEHEVGSARHADSILATLNAPTHIRERVTRLIGEHMRLHLLPDKATDRSLRRFLRDLEDDWEHSVDIAIADAYGKRSASGDISIRARYENYRSRMKLLLEQQQGQTTVVRPINGHDLMSELSVKPGPEMGRLFKALDEELLERPGMSREEALDFVRAQL